MSKRQIILSPSMLSADILNLGAALQALESAGVDWIHVDVMDGHFVPNLSMGLPFVAACKRGSGLPVDVHLMVSNPDPYLEAYVLAGADILTLHVETCAHIHRSLQTIRALGCKAGAALNPGTPVDALQWVIDQVDVVLLLGTNPGFSGQAFLPATIRKAAAVRRLSEAHGVHPIVMVDGGVSVDTINSLAAEGVSAFVAGNAIFNHPEGIHAGVRALRGN